MEELRCKNCDAAIDLNTAAGGVVQCAFCQSVYTLPKKEQTSEVLSYLRMGQNELNCCAFERAYTAFEKAAELDESEPEAYFGMALAEFRVQYLRDIEQDEETGREKSRLQPICHEIADTLFSESAHYQRALALAERAQGEEYARRASEIDYIRKEFFRLSESGLRYDCFICVKVTDQAGNHTEDSFAAGKLYNSLRRAGYKPFFSEYEIGERTGADYEAMILYALYSAKCMLLVCGNREYLNTPWVKNEYTRFLAMIADEEKESGSVAFVFRGKPIERLPNVKGRLQGIDFNSFDALEKAKAFIDRFDEEKQRQAAELEFAARSAAQREEEKRRAAAERERQETARKAEEAARRAAELEQQVKVLGKAQENFRAVPPANQTERQPVAAASETVSATVGNTEDGAAGENGPEFEIENGVLLKYRGKGGAVVIPNEVREIGAEAFEYFDTIVSVTIPRTVRAIGDAAFNECKNLTALLIPNSVTEIGDSAFSNCGKLQSLTVEAGNSVYCGKGNCIIERKTKRLIAGCNASAVPSDGSVHALGFQALNGCTGLQALRVPHTVRVIEDEVCNGCTALKNLVLEEGIEEIGAGAFYACAMENLKIPESVATIGPEAFGGCQNLKTATLPARFRNEAQSIFGKEASCIRFTFTGGNAKPASPGGSQKQTPPAQRATPLEEFAITTDGVLRGYRGRGGDVIIPETVFKIEKDVFASDRKIRSLVIAASVIEIETGAIASGETLETLIVQAGNPRYHSAGNCVIETEAKTLIAACNTSVIPADGTVTSIAGQAFSACNRLQKINIPAPVVAISSYAFYVCSQLQEVSIANSVISIGPVPFVNCYQMQTLLMESGNPKYFAGGNCIVERDSKTLIFGCGNGKISIDDNVEAIGDRAFTACAELREIVIPESVRVIGANAFSYCRNLQKIDLPSGLEEIGREAFRNCAALGSLAIPDRIKKLDAGVLMDCSSLQKITLPDGLTVISDHCFRGCSALREIELPVGLRAICDCVFLGCGLEKLSIPPDVSMGDQVFGGCRNLREITLPARLRRLGQWTFRSCVSLAKIAIPAGVQCIESMAFQECTSLTSVTLPYGLLSIQKEAFRLCTSLAEITLPASLNAIEKFAFWGCKNLRKVTIPEKFKNTAPEVFGDLFKQIYFVYVQGADVNDFTIFKGVLVKYNGKGRNVMIPATVVEIGAGAFNNCREVTSVSIPECVVKIGSAAFAGCDQLTSVVLPQGIEQIDPQMFKGCRSLVSINLPKNLKRIDDEVFNGCEKLESVNIPESVEWIGGMAFAGCRKLVSIVLPENLKKILHHTFSGSGLASITIPEGVEEIWKGAFSDTSFASLEVPDTVKRIRQGAFARCRNLTSVKIGKGICMIEPEVFSNCKNLRQIKLPNSVRVFGESAFENCSGLTQFVLPNETQEIRTRAFAGCGFKSITVPESVVKMGSQVFPAGAEVYCEVKKPLFGMPKGWDKNWTSSNQKVIWNHQKGMRGKKA